MVGSETCTLEGILSIYLHNLCSSISILNNLFCAIPSIDNLQKKEVLLCYGNAYLEKIILKVTINLGPKTNPECGQRLPVG